MSQYFIWLGVNHLSLCDYSPISRFYAGYRYNVAIIDIDGVSLLSLTSSRFTCITQSGSSVVDYFITQAKKFQQVHDMYVSDLTEFSDHCFLAISININSKQTEIIDNTFEIFDWESKDSDLLLDALEAKMEEFDSATEAICSDDSEIDGNIIFLTDVIYNACFSVFGRTVKIKRQSQFKRKPAARFNDQCRTSKGVF